MNSAKNLNAVWEQILPHSSLQMKRSPVNTLTAALGEPELETQLSNAWTPDLYQL